MIKDDLQDFLQSRYAKDNITSSEIDSIIRLLESKSASDLYESNKAIMKMVSDGFLLKREDRNQKDLYIQLIDYQGLAVFRVDKSNLDVIAEQSADYNSDNNIYKLVNQFEIGKNHSRNIPKYFIVRSAICFDETANNEQ